MKHLLNNISQEEKNRILEQHRGGKSIDTTRFKALLESSMGNVKPLIMEGPTGSKKDKKGIGHISKDQVLKRWSMNESEEDADVVVNVNDIDQEDMKCFSDVSTADAKKVGLNHSGRYKVKKRGCMTKTRYKGPKKKYYGNNTF